MTCKLLLDGYSCSRCSRYILLWFNLTGVLPVLWCVRSVKIWDIGSDRCTSLDTFMGMLLFSLCSILRMRVRYAPLLMLMLSVARDTRTKY